MSDLPFKWDMPIKDGNWRIRDNSGGIHMASLWEGRLIDEIERIARQLAEARRALEEIIAVDKAAPGRTDAQIWADMLEIAACAIDPDRHQERKS